MWVSPNGHTCAKFHGRSFNGCRDSTIKTRRDGGARLDLQGLQPFAITPNFFGNKKTYWLSTGLFVGLPLFPYPHFTKADRKSFSCDCLTSFYLRFSLPHSFQAQVNNTDVEPGSTISVPFTVATATNGVMNSSATMTFTVRANNDRSYALTTPSTIAIAAGGGGTANGTVTLTVPASAASGTDVTLTIEAENAAATDVNYAVLRFSVAPRVRGL